jgi:hypothetical protein
MIIAFEKFDGKVLADKGSNLVSEAGSPDFSRYKIPKRGKIT